LQISGKVIVVTGAASGIGKAMCQRFARDGAAAVIAADLDASGARKIAEEIQHQTRSVAVTLDACNESQVALFIEQVIEKFGHIDLQCCNVRRQTMTIGWLG